MPSLLGNELDTLRIIRKEDDWDAIKFDWNDLFQKSFQASPPLHFDWLREWWQVYGSIYGNGGLLIFTIWRGTQLISALPLYLRIEKTGLRSIRFISTGEDEYEELCPDYLNILSLPGEEISSATAMWSELTQLNWDNIELLDLPTDSPLLNLSKDFFKIKQFSRGSCPIADISDGFDAYLGRLTSHSRNKARRLLKDGDRAGIKFEIVESCGATQAFDTLMQLHQERWIADGKLGVFSARRFVEFHQALIDNWLPVGKAILAQLSINNVPIAVLYGFIINGKFDFYQCGIKRGSSVPLRSPGNLANLLLIKALSERGLSEYDFLRGTASYKNELATYDKHLVGIQSWRLTPRTIAHHSVKLPFKLMQKGLRLLKLR